MSYVEANLNPGEEIMYRGQIHWAVGLLFYVFGGLLILSMEPGTMVFGGFLVMLGILRFVLVRITNEYALTNKRVVSKQGFIARRTTELNLNRVESASVDQGIIGRILDYGTVKVRGTGIAEAKFKYLARPMEFRRALMHAIDPPAKEPTEPRLAS